MIRLDPTNSVVNRPKAFCATSIVQACPPSWHCKVWLATGWRGTTSMSLDLYPGAELARNRLPRRLRLHVAEGLLARLRGVLRARERRRARHRDLLEPQVDDDHRDPARRRPPPVDVVAVDAPELLLRRDDVEQVERVPDPLARAQEGLPDLRVPRALELNFYVERQRDLVVALERPLLLRVVRERRLGRELEVDRRGRRGKEVRRAERRGDQRDRRARDPRDGRERAEDLLAEDRRRQDDRRAVEVDPPLRRQDRPEGQVRRVGRQEGDAAVSHLASSRGERRTRPCAPSSRRRRSRSR